MKQRPPPVFGAPPLDRPAWQTYGFAALMLIAAQSGRWLLDPFTQNALPLATMYVAVALTVWFGGWKPATVLAVIGFVAGMWLFMSPRFTFGFWNEIAIVRTGLYIVSCAITIYLCESLRRAERRHAVSEARVVSILDHMRESFCAVDCDWRITTLNQSAEECLGKPRNALLTQRLWDVLPGSVGTPLEVELHRAMCDKTSVQLETNAFVPGAWHDVSATRVGQELSIFCQDITEKRAHLDQLERLVDDRTAALQRIVAELEAFSYTLVHDMRAPLRSISGFAELLAVGNAQQLDPVGKRHLTHIQRAAARMDELITDILAYSQLTRNPPELRIINLDETIREILRSQREFQEDKAGIEIEARLPMVCGNDALLTQCFSNLLHNATKFVARGVKPQIRITGKVNDEIARIEIADNGIGIAPDAVARIFEPFRRENTSYEGTGIGLAIVQKVVDQLGGRVGVESHPGRGSRFWVELKSPAMPHAPSNLAGERVLV